MGGNESTQSSKTTTDNGDGTSTSVYYDSNGNVVTRGTATTSNGSGTTSGSGSGSTTNYYDSNGNVVTRGTVTSNFTPVFKNGINWGLLLALILAMIAAFYFWKKQKKHGKRSK